MIRTVAPVLCLAVGAWAGVKYQKHLATSATFTHEKDGGVHTFTKPGLHFTPTVSAAHPLVPAHNVPATNPGARVSEIMKFGFPGLDNIRAYDDFVLSYDRRNRTAHWVLEHLTKDRVRPRNSVARDNSEFYEDDKIHQFFRASNDDYRGSGYDRGHLAAAGNHRSSQMAMDQTFSLSNISPQVGKGFNRDAWNTLEQYVRRLTNDYPNVYVCTGPLYLPRREADGKLYVKYEVIGRNHVAVPTHFFKAVVMQTPSGHFELQSFIMPNQPLPENIDISRYLVPIDTIERSSGLLLFDEIPRNMFTKINGRC